MSAQPNPELVARAAAAETVADLAALLRELRRRDGRRLRLGRLRTYREIANQTGWSIAVIGGYFAGTKLASNERFDALVRLLGAAPAEVGALATARERVTQRRPSPTKALADRR